ncbi:MAG: SDR family oxidoreductase, partial [Acidimicrobiia bacterium]|nr:SDR family oxidoreductase [Acidimicrobiia bacterium]
SAVASAMDGCDVVFHVAGYNEMCLADPAMLFRVNVDGSRNTLRAAAAVGARRMVYTSSATTLGEERGSVGNERSPHRGWFLSNYERSKYEAERMLLSEKTSVELVVVNPSSVQGPGRAAGTGKLFLDLINGRIPAVVDSHFSIVDIDDCGRGHLLAEASGLAGERYVLSGFTLSTEEAVGLLEEVTGLRLRLPTLPGWLAMGGAGIVEMGSRAVRRRPRFCREMMRVMSFGHSYDGSRAVRDLGLEYTPARQTVRRTIEWFVQEGLVTRELPRM